MLHLSPDSRAETEFREWKSPDAAWDAYAKRTSIFATWAWCGGIAWHSEEWDKGSWAPFQRETWEGHQGEEVRYAYLWL